MASVFTQIRQGDIPGYILEDTGEFFTVLDITPRQKGHALVVPYQEVDDIWDLTQEQYHSLWSYVSSVATRLRTITASRKVAIIVEGMEVPHVHVHLIPINEPSDLDYRYMYQSGEQDELVRVFRKL
jgi:histidine triad (HIT) family protein